MTQKHRWRVCRRWPEGAAAQCRGGRVYQRLLLWTQGPAAAPAAAQLRKVLYATPQALQTSA
jgi:hypothetical protein